MSPITIKPASFLLVALTLAACSDATDGLLSHRTNEKVAPAVRARAAADSEAGLRVRAKPTKASATVAMLPEGDLVEIDCMIEGQSVGGNNVWAHIESAGGFVSDAFLDGAPGFAKGAPRCDVPSSTEPTSPTNPTKPVPSPDGGGGDAGPVTTTPDPVTADIDGPTVRRHVQVFADAVCGAKGACDISTYNGHSPSADLALDILVSDRYGRIPTDAYAFGDRVAAFAIDNKAKYRIDYVIFRQRIDLGSGWRAMEDRGSITQNHYDHVHISFDP